MHRANRVKGILETKVAKLGKAAFGNKRLYKLPRFSNCNEMKFCLASHLHSHLFETPNKT